MVCNFNQHWATCELDLVNCKLELWDSKQHIFEDIHYEIRTTAFTPVARIVPQVLKYMRFYDNRPGVKPTYSQWPLSFPVQNVIKQSDSESCGPIALKYAVCLLQGVAVKKMTKKDVQEWRNHIAECIYNFSTDGSTIEFWWMVNWFYLNGTNNLNCFKILGWMWQNNLYIYPCAYYFVVFWYMVQYTLTIVHMIPSVDSNW